MSNHSKGSRGFTIAEVIFALGFVAATVLLLVGFFFRTMASQTKSSHQSVAAAWAESLCERAEEIGPDAPGYYGFPDSGYTEQTNLKVADEEIPVTFTAQLYEKELADQGSTRLGVLKWIEVEVWWGDSADGSIAQTGRTSVKASRMYYLED